jgi:DNA polymerase III epsilon subunit-like protein
MNYVIIDLETTGLNPRTDRIIEVCAIRVRNGNPVTLFNTLVQYDGVLEQKITDITGHTSEDLKGGMDEETMANVLLDIIGDDLVIAHNAPFDLFFIESLFNRQSDGEFGDFDNPFVDTLTVSRARSGYPHKLGDMCKKYGIVLEDAHSAYNDAMATLDLVEAFIAEDVKKPQQKAFHAYTNEIGYNPKYGAPDWKPAHVNAYPLGAQVIQHTAPKQQKPVIKSNMKKVTPKNNRSPRPDPTIEMPTGFLNAENMHAIDAFLSGSLETNQGYLTLNAQFDEAEFNAIMVYLLEVKQLPEDLVQSYEDAGEMIVEVGMPSEGEDLVMGCTTEGNA